MDLVQKFMNEPLYVLYDNPGGTGVKIVRLVIATLLNCTVIV